MGEKRFIEEKYADILLVLAHKFINENPDKKDTAGFKAMEKTLETMDKYWAYINRMGFMMYEASIQAMKEYLKELAVGECEYTPRQLTELSAYLETVRR